MRVSFQFLEISYPQKDLIPDWSNKVDRWYQLDGMAYAFCEALYQRGQSDFDSLILASPGASSLTDYQYAQGETPSPQKFVHTLPNVRASMALQVLDKKCELLCLQNGAETLHTGLIEFWENAQDQENSLFASSFPLAVDKSPQSPKTYGVLTLSQDKNGTWEMLNNDQKVLSDDSIISNLRTRQSFIELGSWTLEKRT